MVTGRRVVRWGAPDSDRRVKAYKISVSSVDKTYRVDADARRVRVSGLTNGKQYRARVAPVYRSGPGPATATPAFVPTSSYSYFQSLTARRIVDRGETVAAQRGGTVSVDRRRQRSSSGVRHARRRRAGHG